MKASARGIARAVEALTGGRLVLHPTETVVSLSGDPYSTVAVEAARRLKGAARPRPFLCLVADAASARALAGDWPDAAEALAVAFWPGPLTLVVAAGRDAPAPVVAEGRIALRPAADPVSRRLLNAWGRPLFSTSANLGGGRPTTSVSEAVRVLSGAPGAEALAIALTPLGGNSPPTDPPVARLEEPSTIVDVTTVPPQLVRLGALTVERLKGVCPDIVGGCRNEPGGRA